MCGSDAGGMALFGNDTQRGDNRADYARFSGGAVNNLLTMPARTCR